MRRFITVLLLVVALGVGGTSVFASGVSEALESDGLVSECKPYDYVFFGDEGPNQVLLYLLTDAKRKTPEGYTVADIKGTCSIIPYSLQIKGTMNFDTGTIKFEGYTEGGKHVGSGVFYSDNDFGSLKGAFTTIPGGNKIDINLVRI